MRALSLTQPWASLVANGSKTMETRSWKTAYRGPLAIHAAKGFPAWARAIVCEPTFGCLLGFPQARELPVGAIVAVCDLVACVSTDVLKSHPRFVTIYQDVEFEFLYTYEEDLLGDFSGRRFAWLLANVRALDAPIPAKGALGVWEWPPPPGFVAPVKHAAKDA